jgi:far upstream element-binding protein
MLYVLFQAEAGGSPALIARGFGSGQPGSEQFEMTVPDNKVFFSLSVVTMLF